MLAYSSSAGTMNVLAVASRALLGTPVSLAMTFSTRLRANRSGRLRANRRVRLLASRSGRLRASGRGHVFGFVVAALLTMMARLWHHAREHEASEAKIALIAQQLAHSDKS